MSVESHEPGGLRRQYTILVFVFAVGIGAITLGAIAMGAGSAGLRWAIPTAIVAGFELRFLRAHLAVNHPAEAEEREYNRLGIPNLLSLLRGGAFAATAGFVLLEPVSWIAWLPAILYGGGSALDWVDGFLAKARGQTTVLGERLDMAFDTLGFLVAPLVGVVWGRLPVFYLGLSAARYLFKGGTALRRNRGLPVYDLPASSVRRPLAGLQMAFITVALAPVLPTDIVFPAAAVVLTPSLAIFARDYLVVAGHVGGQNNNN